MANIDLSKMNLSELKALEKDVDSAIKGFEKKQRNEALQAMEDAAKAFGYSVMDLVGVKSGKGSKTAADPKYQHPENASITWSGRGRQPKWFIDAMATGKTKEDLEIK